MLDYLEKQIILDYHMRGEQDILEDEDHDLSEKAKKYLGSEMYYELGNSTGKQLTKSDPHFKWLMKKITNLNEEF